MYPHRSTATADIAAGPAAVFDYADDSARFLAPLARRSALLAGGALEPSLDAGQGRRVGSHITLSGEALGLMLVADAVVTERDAPHRKAWQTVGRTGMLVLGDHQFAFTVEPHGAGARLRVTLDYALPDGLFGRVLGNLLGRAYAHWCVRALAQGAARGCGA